MDGMSYNTISRAFAHSATAKATPIRRAVTSSTDTQNSSVAAPIRRSCRSVPFVWGIDLCSRTNWTLGTWRISRGWWRNIIVQWIKNPSSRFFSCEVYDELYEELTSSYKERDPRIFTRGKGRWVFC
ncbi:uncharacterized protein ASPGLDRAFT_215982 [Aspergillus glaucus CBS 516.65]|uniref:Uncharacterized protein n=1 Tax=Aspergillus glaucus CBS 516.65 TaxID=1160497 RepID=A0A1L9VZ78_ASPGL|nr:hypothetical protein ASPGLDRAFT_215982 [Aspergillus glaucus CBS 516.65]OJJ89223.1 hypothetical protein ASPGLDRAFT_215982 [Aspergillus glaucus CBS 516.65]